MWREDEIARIEKYLPAAMSLSKAGMAPEIDKGAPARGLPYNPERVAKIAREPANRAKIAPDHYFCLFSPN